MEKDHRPGAVRGVFIPAFITIAGVVLFIRFPWIASQAGFFGTLGIVLLAWFIAITTSLGISSVFSEKKAGIGGLYYMISRSLGLPVGGTLALSMFMSLSFSTALFVVGFTETLLFYFGFEPSPQNIRLFGSAILLIIAIISVLGAKFQIKIRFWAFLIVIISLGFVFFGNNAVDQGEIPNLKGIDSPTSWIALFALFFPAVIGFESGFSISSQLRKPGQNILKGIIWSGIVGLFIYIFLTWFFTFRFNPDLLYDNKLILPKLVNVPELIYFNIFVVALLAAFSSLFIAPRILQASAVDKITPGFFAKGIGKKLIPRNALLFSFVIALAGIMIGSFDKIASFTTVFFLITYGFINLALAFESLFNKDFKPAFRIHYVLNFVVAAVCLILITQIHIISLASITFILALIYLFLKKREYSLQSGNSWMGFLAAIVKTGLHGLSKRIDKSITWRPNIILFSGPVKRRPHLIELAKMLVGKPGIFTNFELVESAPDQVPLTKTEQTTAELDVSGKYVFSRKHICPDLFDGIDNISRFYGFSGFEPNTVLMGWPHRHKDPERFSKSLKNLKSLDLNTVLLSYRKLTGFGNKAHIDFWWNGTGRNLSFALTLLRYITSSPDWRHAQIRILVISYESQQTEKLYRSIRQALNKNKINARIKVIHNNIEQIPESKIIKAESLHTDLSILEIPDQAYSNLLPVFSNIDETLELIDTALVINASSAFEELNADTLKEPSPVFASFPSQSLHSEFIQGISMPKKEILMNEVFTTAGNLDTITSAFLNNGFQKILNTQVEYLNELKEFSLRVFLSLEKTIGMPDDEYRQKAFQKNISDISFTSQKQLESFKTKLVKKQYDLLTSSLSVYLDELHNYIQLIPDKASVQFSRTELEIHPNDSFRLRFFKLFHRIFNAPSAKIRAKIRIRPSADYYIYQQQLLEIKDTFKLFGTFSFSQVSELRKIYATFYETVEKIRINKNNPEIIKEIFVQQRASLLNKIESLKADCTTFVLGVENHIYGALRQNFNQWASCLDNPDQNFSITYLLHKEKSSFVKNEQIQKIPLIWQKNISLYVSKCHLDFVLLGLKNRISAKIRKKTDEFHSIVESQVLSELKMVKEQVREQMQPGYAAKPGHINIRFKSRAEMVPVEFFNVFYKEIENILKELPEKITIIEESNISQINQGQFIQSEDIEVALRKTARYYLSMELINPAQKLLHSQADELNHSAQIIKDVVRLTNFNLENTSGDLAEVFDDATNALKKKDLLESMMQRIHEEEVKVIEIVEEVKNRLEIYLNNAFEPLNILSIARNSETMSRKIKAAQNKNIFSFFSKSTNFLKSWGQKRLVSIIYSQSEGMLLARNIELKPVTVYSRNENFLKILEQVSPRKEIIKDIPFYYQSLFSNRSSISADFWVGMKGETETINRVIERYRSGFAGGLLIIGERNSGKSSLSKNMAKKYFSAECIHSVLAPKSGSVIIEDFYSALQKTFVSNKTVDEIFLNMAPGQVLIIHDLELWWERSFNGLEVIREIARIIDTYASKCFFIVNVNSHAYEFIEKFIPLNGLFIGTVKCKPFDARELKQMIMLRHKAGGLSFVLDKQPEKYLREWDFARLFNRFFDISDGKPGVAINLWLASIRNIKDKTLFLETPKKPDMFSIGVIETETALLILQFVLHRRFSPEKLARIMNISLSQSLALIHALLRAGILEEKFKDVFALNPYLEPFLVQSLKEMELL